MTICILVVTVVACGRNDAALDQFADTEAVEKCAFFESGVVPEIFAVDSTLVTYRSSIPSRRAGHVLCSASWDRPDKAEQEAAFQAAMQTWMMSRVKGEKTSQPVYPKLESQVSITLVANEFDSPQEAAASLEGTVATLSEGVKFEVTGKAHETRMSFGEWEENIGDKAIFTIGGELLFAADAKRYAVSVSVSDDVAEERALAIAVAQRIIDH